MKKNIVITGGHVTPAVSVIQELQKRGSVNIYFYGRSYTFSEAKDAVSFEYKSITDIKIPFINIEAPRFSRLLSIHSILFPFQFAREVVKSYFYLTKHTPICILSFGGYVGAPVVIAGWIRGIMIILHEQTLAPGKANIFLSRFARKLFVSWKESKRYFPRNVQKRCVVSGNPIRQNIRDLSQKEKNRGKINTLYITGGSTGAHRINHVVGKILEVLTSKYNVIHQCGDSQYRDFESLTEKVKTLPTDNKRNYHLYKYITEDIISDVFSHTDILIGRSGANTTAEVAVLAMPSIFIPLPESAGDEQQKQAEMIQSHGGGILITQESLTADILVAALNTIEHKLSYYQKNAKDFSNSKDIRLHTTAHTRIADYIDQFVSHRGSMVSSK